MNYKMQFDKLTRAYIRNEVNPFISCNCFVGNLLNNRGRWDDEREFGINYDILSVKNTYWKSTTVIEEVIEQEAEGYYTPDEILRLERMFLTTFINNVENYRHSISICTTEDEDALFKAFDSTLELLKTIHIAHGEVIEEESIPEFKKRNPQTV